MSISISAISLNMRKKGSLLTDIYHFNYPFYIKCPYSKNKNKCHLECIEEIKNSFQMYLPADEVAAVFFKPIAGDSGIIVPPKRYVENLHELCKENNILFVADEIQQSLGRYEYWFSMEHFNIKPDLIIIGKSLDGDIFI